MQLLSMEVNQLGTADRTQVGVLSAGLNAVCGRKGSGKSSLIQWLRGIIQPANSQLHDRSATMQATGRLNLRLGSAEIQLERSQRAGKTDSKKTLRHSTSAWNGNHAHAPAHWAHTPTADAISPLQRNAFDRLAAIPSDPHATYRLWEAARDLQLDDSAPSRFAEERNQLVSREQDLLAQLKTLDGLNSTREGLLGRKRQLENELERVRRQSVSRHYLPGTDEHHRLSDRLAALNRDMQTIRDEIGEVDAAIARTREDASHQTFAAGDQRTYRQRLLSLDAQLARWRNTLTEIRAHRERLESAATDAHLAGQLGEQFSPINQADPRLALRSLEAQIVEARRHFDSMLAGVERYRDEFDHARNELPQTLRLMQRELHEVCQQLSRHESLTSSRAMKDQILQLTRCEGEMRLAIERLIAERGELLRAIATACHLSVDQVTLAYSDNCRCADHPHLDSWLSAISTSPTDAPSAEAMGGTYALPMLGHGSMPAAIDRLAQLEAQRKAAMSRLDDAQHDHRDTENRLRRLGVMPVATNGIDRAEVDLLRELDLVNDELHRLENRDRLRVELTEVRRRLQQLPSDSIDIHSLRGRYNHHIAALTGRPLQRDSVDPRSVDPRSADLRSSHGSWDSISSRLWSTPSDPVHQTVPTHIAPRLEETALRLAISEVLTARGHHVPMILDETLDGLDSPYRLAAVRYLASQSDVSRVQVIVMTDDKEVVEAVRAVRGNVVPVVVSRAVASEPVRAAYDVNRQLTAYANDFEADKWSEPEWTPPVVQPETKRRWVLTERSEIEEVPSIGAVNGARLRALGIDRVADLLDADATWVADQARLAGVHGDTVRAWQNECRLLCGMPQLRPFDARILAGAGVRDHHQLTETEPSRLLQRVEQFLGTERGRNIMRTGSSYELSRLTSWLASANRGVSSDGSHRESSDDHSSPLAADTRRARARRTPIQRTDAAHATAPTYHIVDRDDRDVVDSQLSTSDRRSQRRRPRRERGERPQRGDANVAKRTSNVSTSGSQDSRGLRFYLELTSPVVDAPSIGATMAESLADVQVHTVEDLLATNPENLAHDLGQPRVTGAIIRAWQDQARLVCRVPNLRGHDAQILVACGITSPEALCRMDPNALLAQASSFASSTQGQRVLRGSQAPDLAEIKEWINWAGQSRNLMAA